MDAQERQNVQSVSGGVGNSVRDAYMLEAAYKLRDAIQEAAVSSQTENTNIQRRFLILTYILVALAFAEAMAAVGTILNSERPTPLGLVFVMIGLFGTLWLLWIVYQKKGQL